MSLTATIETAGLDVTFPGTANERVGNAIQGETVRIQAKFKNFAGTLIDPTGVAFWVWRESDVPTAVTFWMYGTGQIARISTGIYYLDVDTSFGSGPYAWRIEGTSYSAKQGIFYIEPANPA